LSSNDTISKVYKPNHVERRWYNHWVKMNYFHAEVNPNRKPYTIIIPPPNVTGSLTIGHVLNNTIQDILIRRARMKGFEVCWVPGTDHASIATETKVTNMLTENGLDKNAMGREEFLEHAWKWKSEYGSLIIKQLKKLGCSCDWERERFTMDDAYYKSVISAFIRLYNKGLIYRGKRLVNWCPATKSAISDEEVIYKETNAKLWYLKYPIFEQDGFLTVATTRPETILGDTAVAVNPKDKRFKKLVGKSVKLPLTDRIIPIIADDFVDPEFGTGCVKVTPAHDPNDFQLGQNHNLEFVNIFNPDGTLNNKVPSEYIGLDRFDAREKVIASLDSLGLFEKSEDYITSIGFSERGGVPVEPYLSEQWFMSMKELSKPALDAVRNGEIKFFPSHWKKTYEHWMTNIQDWCISRQLWWGHRIPVWYCYGKNKGDETQRCQEIIISENCPDVCPNCGSNELVQDPDVLDTWSSSWLWPIGVHNWPDESEDLDFFHPTDDLVTGPDIIFFWVARMVMASIEFKGEIPFKNVYFTGMVRDLKGQKMSKSLGNSPDPLVLIDQFGADALRFGIMLIAPQGQDILFSEERVEVGRNFMNKIWNVSRFLRLAGEKIEVQHISNFERDALNLSDKWIVSNLNRTIIEVNRSFEKYRFNEVAKKIYDFTWSDFCDWYVESIKSRLNSEHKDERLLAYSIANYIIENILTLLHPFAPFVTEELWHRLNNERKNDIIVESWPKGQDDLIETIAEENFKEIQEIITSVRIVRSEMNIPPGIHMNLYIRCENPNKLIPNTQIICDLAKLDNLVINVDIERPQQSATVVLGQKELFIPLGDLIDIDEEKKRLAEKIESFDGKLRLIEKKLNNSNFIERAPKEVVDRERKKFSDMKEKRAKLENNISFFK